MSPGFHFAHFFFVFCEWKYWEVSSELRIDLFYCWNEDLNVLFEFEQQKYFLNWSLIYHCWKIFYFIDKSLSLQRLNMLYVSFMLWFVDISIMSNHHRQHIDTDWKRKFDNFFFFENWTKKSPFNGYLIWSCHLDSWN